MRAAAATPWQHVYCCVALGIQRARYVNEQLMPSAFDSESLTTQVYRWNAQCQMAESRQDTRARLARCCPRPLPERKGGQEDEHYRALEGLAPRSKPSLLSPL